MAAEAAQQMRMARGDGIERIADMQSGYRPRRALDLAVANRRKRDYRAMGVFLDARGHQADHALVPGFVEQAQAARQRRHVQMQARYRRERLLLHRRPDGASLTVQGGEFPG